MQPADAPSTRAGLPPGEPTASGETPTTRAPNARESAATYTPAPGAGPDSQLVPAETTGPVETPKPAGNGHPRAADAEPARSPSTLVPRADYVKPPQPNGGASARPGSPRTLRVTIQRTLDGRSDAKRVGDAHRLLLSFPGKDRFVFYVTGGNGSYELDFPNDTTLICDELLTRLRSLLGPQAVHLIE